MLKRLLNQSKQRIITDKRGSYIVETALGLPLLLTVMVVLASVILMYAAIEGTTFIGVNEMRLAAIEARKRTVQPELPFLIEQKTTDEYGRIRNISVREYGYRSYRYGIDELIYLRLNVEMATENPLSLRAEAAQEISYITRAYVGKERRLYPMSQARMESREGEAVFVFPESGEHYHQENCTYNRAQYRSGTLTEQIRRKYKPCDACDSESVRPGSTIYYFPLYGEHYHKKGCRSLERRSVEMELEVAERRGYRPCSKCGG